MLTCLQSQTRSYTLLLLSFFYRLILNTLLLSSAVFEHTRKFAEDHSTESHVEIDENECVDSFFQPAEAHLQTLRRETCSRVIESAIVVSFPPLFFLLFLNKSISYYTVLYVVVNVFVNKMVMIECAFFL